MTVGQLKKRLYSMPDDAIVIISSRSFASNDRVWHNIKADKQSTNPFIITLGKKIRQ